MKKNFIWIGITIIMLLFVFYFVRAVKTKEKIQKLSQRERPQIKVDAFIVKPSILINEISVSGSLMAYEEVELKNEVAGRVVELNLPEGKSVRKGTLLVKLYDDDLQATLKKLEAELAVKEQIFKRQNELLKVNGISQNDYEQTRLDVNSLKADIEEQEAQIRKTEVLAPFDGKIGLRNISIGAVVNSSTLLATIRSEDNLKLDFFVPEKYSPEIRPGMKVEFALYNNEEKMYNATVIATEEGIDASTRNLKVRAVVESRSPELLSGAFTNVNMHIGDNKNALMVPTQTIIPQEKNKSIIISKKRKAHFVNVKTGIRKASSIEITQGIQSGDTVITSGLLFLKEGSKLSFSSVTDSL